MYIIIYHHSHNKYNDTIYTFYAREITCNVYLARFLARFFSSRPPGDEKNRRFWVQKWSQLPIYREIERVPIKLPINRRR
jgi:hypothetical protein